MAETQPDRLTAIEDALHALVTAIGDHDAAQFEARASRPPEPLEIIAIDDITLEGIEDSRLKGIVKDPVRYALRAALKETGRDMFKVVGSTDAMLDALHRVADRDPVNAGRRGAIMDSAWNGLGEGNDRWWS